MYPTCRLLSMELDEVWQIWLSNEAQNLQMFKMRRLSKQVWWNPSLTTQTGWNGMSWQPLDIARHSAWNAMFSFLFHFLGMATLLSHLWFSCGLHLASIADFFWGCSSWQITVANNGVDPGIPPLDVVIWSLVVALFLGKREHLKLLLHHGLYISRVFFKWGSRFINQYNEI